MIRLGKLTVAAALVGSLLAPVPAGASDTVLLSGAVRDGSGHGWPLWSKVSVTGGPSTHSSPWNGRYQLRVRPGSTYTVTVQPDAAGYPALTREIQVGRRDTVADFAVPVDADRCEAPGYRHASDGLTESFDTGAQPNGWTTTDEIGDGEGWRFDDPGKRGNLTGGLAGFAILDSEFYGFVTAQDASLVSPVVDLRGIAEPTVGFRSDFFVFDYPEVSGIGDVDVSLDGGTTWQNVWREVLARRGPDQVTVPIPQAAGQPSVRVRFRYHETEITAAEWWQVDSVWIGNRSCEPIPGGLAVGQVRDRNTGAGLAGATVRGPDGRTVRSVATPDDPGLGDGFYAVFSPAVGTRELTAGQPEYQSQARRVLLTGNQANRVDFSLAAGLVTSSRTTVRTDQDLGERTTATLTLRNEGTADATVTLAERPGDFTLARPRGSTAVTAATGAGAPTRRLDGSFSPLAGRKGARNLTSGTPAAVAGDAWTGTADYPISISDNAAATYQGKVYSVGGQEDFEYGVRDAYVFDPAGGAWSALPELPRGRQAPTAAFLGGKLHVIGGWSESIAGYDATVVPELDIYDPATGQWTTGPSIPSAAAAAGSAVLDDQLYVVGGCPEAELCGSAKVFRYDLASRSWGRLADYPAPVSWTSCGAIEETVYCAGGSLEHDGVDRSTKATYAYDPHTDSWSPRADLPIDLWASSGAVTNGRLTLAGGVTNGTQTVTNQTFGYDPLADAWMTLPNSTYPTYRGAAGCGFYKVGGGTAHTLSTPFVELLPGQSDCGSDRDSAWLSATPTGKVVLRPGDRVTVRLRLDAGVVSQPGIYTAQALVREDTPYPIRVVDVAMKVEPPWRWALLSGSISGVGCDGVVRPLPGATAWLDGKLADFTLPTDSDGKFARWLDSRNAPGTLIAGLDGWVPEVRDVDLRAGRETALDIRLTEADCPG